MLISVLTIQRENVGAIMFPSKVTTVCSKYQKSQPKRSERSRPFRIKEKSQNTIKFHCILRRVRKKNQKYEEA